MYLPPAFREDRLEVLHDLMRAYPLATLISAGSQGLTANLVPFTLADADSDNPYGVLKAHLAKANDQLAALREGQEALIVFHGPQAYVPPSWYPSKAQHGQVVPTWNYIVVQAHGTPKVIEDAQWVLAQINVLTDVQEQGRANPWRVEDAPSSFIESQLKGIVGLEIPIARIEGKWKVSQNRPLADRHGVLAGLRQEGAPDAMIRAVEKHAISDSST